MLWEGTFYEEGVAVAERIATLVPQCQFFEVAQLAIKARNLQKLRHVPLLMAREMARHSMPTTADTLAEIIQRPDELSEFLSLYWMDDPDQPLSAQVKKGLAKAFRKFDEYQLAKYDRPAAISLRDVMFLTHPKPKDDKQAEVWKKLVNGTLSTPDTWEVALSTGEDVCETFTRLLTDNKLGYMALLRNLRNMADNGVDRDLIASRIMAGAMKSKALPFRFIAAANAAPMFERILDEAMGASLLNQEHLTGHTVVMVDVSASMGVPLSGKSKLTRMDAACGLAILLDGVCERVSTYTFSRDLEAVPPRRGMALRDAIMTSQPHASTHLRKAFAELVSGPEQSADRYIIITDEQSQDGGPERSVSRGYILNVGSYENGVAYGPWVHINGFSEASVAFIQELEADMPF
jgi:hypothetical protein